MAFVKKFYNLLFRAPVITSLARENHYHFTDSRMLKDFNKRQKFKKYGKEKLRLNSMRKNKILPPELRVIVDEEVAALPRASSICQLRNRCCVTSRPRGIVRYFRVSRIIFRHLADYNYLSGVQRSMW